MLGAFQRFGRLGAPAGRSLESAVRALFSDGQQGFWYDSQDLSTLFQDSAGTTPCTMPGQGVAMPVGFQIDKRLGAPAVLGPELVVNGDFSGGTTGWTAVRANLSVSGGALIVGGTAGYPGAYQSFSTTAGRWYKIEFAITSMGTTTTVRCAPKNGAGDSGTALATVDFTTTGTKTVHFLAIGTTSTFFVLAEQNLSVSFNVDNISVRELPGNHRFQTGSTSRAQLSARVNLLTYTEQLSGTGWASFVSGSAITNTSGTLNFPNSISGATYALWRGTITSPAGAYTASVKIKAGTASAVYLRLSDGTGAKVVSLLCNLTSEYQTFSVSGTCAANARLEIGANGYDGESMTAGTVLVKEADLRAANESASLPPYQRVVDSLTYDTAGFPLFIQPDGSDDFMVTNSIDFSASDKVFVCAGVRKLSDSALGGIAELSTSTSSNGMFAVWAGNPSSGLGTPGYGFSSRGTANQAAIVVSGYGAPISNVFTGTGDISLDSVILRLNGTQTASNTADQGTGNYGNYPMYFYRRGGTTLPFSGRDYGMVCRGGTLPSAAEIAQVERWLASKTGVVLA